MITHILELFLLLGAVHPATFGHCPVLALVGPGEVGHQNERNDAREELERHADSVTLDEARPVGTGKDKARNDAAGVADTDDDGGRDGLFERATDAVGLPGSQSILSRPAFPT